MLVTIRLADTDSDKNVMQINAQGITVIVCSSSSKHHWQDGVVYFVHVRPPYRLFRIIIMSSTPMQVHMYILRVINRNIAS